MQRAAEPWGRLLTWGGPLCRAGAAPAADHPSWSLLQQLLARGAQRQRACGSAVARLPWWAPLLGRWNCLLRCPGVVSRSSSGEATLHAHTRTTSALCREALFEKHAGCMGLYMHLMACLHVLLRLKVV